MAMVDDSIYADLLSALSPVSRAGLNPDEAAADRAGTMAKLLGPNDTPQAKWYDPPAEEAQNSPPPLSPNGNVLPAGLHSRQQPASTPPPQPGAPGAVTQGGEPVGRQIFTPTAGTTPAVPPGATGATPAGVSSTGIARPAAAPDLAGANAATIALGQTAYAKSLQDVDRMAGQPSEQDDPAIAKAEQAQANYAVPTNPNAKDPATGKPLYRPSIGTRILRGVEGYARGGIVGALDPSLVGASAYGAPNGEYDYTERARQARENLAGTQYQQAKDAWVAAEARNKEVTAARSKNVTDLAPVTKAATDQEDVPIKQETADSDVARAYNGSPAGKSEAQKELNETNYSNRMSQLKDPTSPVSKVSSADQAYWVANGKLPDPDRYHAPAEEVLFNRAYNAEATQHPKRWKPTLDDIRNVAEAAKGADPDAMASARAETTRVRAAAAQLVAATRKLTAAHKADTDNLDSKKQPSIDAEVQEAEREYEQAQAAMTQPAPAAAPAAVAAKPSPKRAPNPKDNPVGSSIVVNGQPHAILGYNPQTGKPIVGRAPMQATRPSEHIGGFLQLG